jgi:hypothetical protein
MRDLKVAGGNNVRTLGSSLDSGAVGGEIRRGCQLVPCHLASLGDVYTCPHGGVSTAARAVLTRHLSKRKFKEECLM